MNYTPLKVIQTSVLKNYANESDGLLLLPTQALRGWPEDKIVEKSVMRRGEVRRIISMRKANEREIKAVGTALD